METVVYTMNSELLSQYQSNMNKRKQATSRKKFFTHSFKTVGNLPHITSGSVVLEVGCGFGQTTVTLAKKFGCRVDAFDPCPHFIAQAKEYARMEGVTASLFC